MRARTALRVIENYQGYAALDRLSRTCQSTMELDARFSAWCGIHLLRYPTLLSLLTPGIRKHMGARWQPMVEYPPDEEPWPPDEGAA